MFRNFDPYDFALSMMALVICITIHEFAHAYSADRVGDETPRKQGRISLNPLDHLDPMGTIMMIVSSLSGFGIGWGKPVQVNHFNFKHPRWDNLWMSLWGPLSNILTAALVGIILYLAGASISTPVLGFLTQIVFISLCLAFFNLIPISPLDGSHILSSLLPVEQARKYDMFMGRFGFMVLLGLVFLVPDALSAIIKPPTYFLYYLLVPAKVLLKLSLV
jgi:Zn-dependent protease